MGEIIVAQSHGFCEGVKSAITILNMAVNEFDKVYVLHELVHNPFVINSFKDKGVVFVDSLDEVPDDSALVFSAHGVSPAFRKKAEEKNLKVIDATCSLVQLVHDKVRNYSSQGYTIIYIGKKGHAEVEGVLGEADMFVINSAEDVDKLNIDNGKLVCLTQTTLSVDDAEEIPAKLKEKFPELKFEGGICHATTNRQNAVKDLAKKCDLVLVLGAKNSSNSNKLMETAKKQGVPAYLILDKSELKEEWLNDVQTIGISSGASCPEFLLDELVNELEKFNFSVRKTL